MPNLALDSNSESIEKKGRWDKWLTIMMVLIIVFFSWVILSNGFLLVFGRPLIDMHH
jgi:hypothetical protein